MTNMKWLTIRVALLAVAIFAAIAHQDHTSAPDPLFWIITSVVVAITMFAYLCDVDRKHSIDKSAPYSLTSPFYPQSRYPLQQLVVGGYFLTVFGAIRIALPLYTQHRLVGSSLCFVFGIVMLLTVCIWLRFYGKRIGSR